MSADNWLKIAEAKVAKERIAALEAELKMRTDIEHPNFKSRLSLRQRIATLEAENEQLIDHIQNVARYFDAIDGNNACDPGLCEKTARYAVKTALRSSNEKA